LFSAAHVLASSISLEMPLSLVFLSALGFDTTKSEVKTLRKHAEQLKEVMGSKPVARKYFNDIKAVSTTPNGRFNEHMIILKAF
jgi:hypothetical protein